jgi:hypothetical protein
LSSVSFITCPTWQVLKLSWQIANNNTPKQNGQDQNDNINIITTGDDRTSLQALALINDCNKYKMDLTTNGVVITDAIKFVQTNKEKLSMATKGEDEGSKKILFFMRQVMSISVWSLVPFFHMFSMSSQISPRFEVVIIKVQV